MLLSRCLGGLERLGVYVERVQRTGLLSLYVCIRLLAFESLWYLLLSVVDPSPSEYSGVILLATRFTTHSSYDRILRKQSIAND